MGHPPGARGRADRRLPGRGDRGARAGRLRGHRPRHGRRRELQQRVGGAGQARLRLPLPPRVRPPHRRLGRLGGRVEGRSRRDALEARRRGRPALQPGLLRGPRGPRPRSPGRAFAADLGLRDQLGLVRAVHQGPGPAAAAQARAPRLGGGGVLRADLLHRLPHAHGSRRAAGRPSGAHLGRRRRPGGLRHPAVPGGRRGVRGRRLLGAEGRAHRAAGRQGRSSTATSSRA